jgi:hypothetical protein
MITTRADRSACDESSERAVRPGRGDKPERAFSGRRATGGGGRQRRRRDAHRRCRTHLTTRSHTPAPLRRPPHRSLAVSNGFRHAPGLLASPARSSGTLRWMPWLTLIRRCRLVSDLQCASGLTRALPRPPICLQDKSSSGDKSSDSGSLTVSIRKRWSKLRDRFVTPSRKPTPCFPAVLRLSLCLAHCSPQSVL